MSKVCLTLTDGFRSAPATQLAKALSEYLEIEGPQLLFRKSADQLPQFIQLLGDVAAWAPLSVPVAAFFTRLAIKAADTTWDMIHDALKKEEVKPLAGVSNGLAKAVKAIPESATISIGLNVPDDNFGTIVQITDTSPENIALCIARFVSKIEPIAEAIGEEIERRGIPLGEVHLEFLDNGKAIIRWTSYPDLVEHERLIL